jgi:hypothetical protein
VEAQEILGRAMRVLFERKATRTEGSFKLHLSSVSRHINLSGKRSLFIPVDNLVELFALLFCDLSVLRLVVLLWLLGLCAPSPSQPTLLLRLLCGWWAIFQGLCILPLELVAGQGSPKSKILVIQLPFQLVQVIILLA